MTFKPYPEKNCALCGELHQIPRNARYCNDCKILKAETRKPYIQIDILGRRVYT